MKNKFWSSLGQESSLTPGESSPSSFPKNSNKERRYWQWAFTHDPLLPAPTRVLLHALALRISPEGEGTRVLQKTLASDVGGSLELLRKHFPPAIERGYLRGFWERGRNKGPTEWVPCFPGNTREEAKERLAIVWALSPLPRPWKEEVWEPGDRSYRIRWWWERAIRRAPELSFQGRGLLWPLGLYSTGDGKVRRMITLAHLSRWSGFSRRTCRLYLDRALDLGWLDGWGEGGGPGRGKEQKWLLTLRFPDGDPEEAGEE